MDRKREERIDTGECPLSPILFSLLMTNMEERLVKIGQEKERSRGVSPVGKRENEIGMRLMMRGFE